MLIKMTHSDFFQPTFSKYSRIQINRGELFSANCDDILQALFAIHGATTLNI